jgi:hypothetical protein
MISRSSTFTLPSVTGWLRVDLIAISSRRRCTLFEQLVGARENGWRNFQAECLCRLEIDDQLELGRLFHWQIGCLGPLENFVDVGRGAPMQRSVRAPFTINLAQAAPLPNRLGCDWASTAPIAGQ